MRRKDEAKDKSERMPLSVAACGAAPGDILTGQSKQNRDLVIRVIDPFKPCPDRHRIAEVVLAHIGGTTEKKETVDNLKSLLMWPSNVEKNNSSDGDASLKKRKVSEEVDSKRKNKRKKDTEKREDEGDVSSEEDVSVLECAWYTLQVSSRTSKEAKALGSKLSGLRLEEVEKKLKSLGLDMEYLAALPHTPLINSRFEVLDCGTGEKGEVFQIAWEQSGKTAITYEDVSRVIAAQGDSAATFFFNRHNLFHSQDPTISKGRVLTSAGSSDFSVFKHTFKLVREQERLTAKWIDGVHLSTHNWTLSKYPTVIFTSELDIGQKPPSSMLHKRPTFSFLKSLLQKHIRRMNPKEAVITAKRLLLTDRTYDFQAREFRYGINELLQRLLVITLEDVAMHPSYSAVTWLAAVSTLDSFWLSEEHIEFLFRYVEELALHKDHLPLPTKTTTESEVNLDTLEAANPFAPFLASMQMRLSMAGMKGDKIFIRQLITQWKKAPLDTLPDPKCWSLSKYITPGAVGSLVAFMELIPPLSKEECIYQAVDFHVWPSILDRILEESMPIAVSMNRRRKKVKAKSSALALKKYLWFYSSCHNQRDSEDLRRKERATNNLDDAVDSPIFKKEVLYIFQLVANEYINKKVLPFLSNTTEDQPH